MSIEFKDILRVVIPAQAEPKRTQSAHLLRKRGGDLVLSKKGEPIVTNYVPPSARAWELLVRERMILVARSAEHRLWDGPVALFIITRHTCPKSDLVRDKARVRWNAKHRSDPDNLSKPIMDAGNLVWWEDDRQIALLQTATLIERHGVGPTVDIRARALDPFNLEGMDELLGEFCSTSPGA